MAVPQGKTGQRKPRAAAPMEQAQAPAAAARNGKAPPEPRPVLAPVPAPRPRRRRWHVAALTAALLYAAAAYAAYTIVTPQLRDEPAPRASAVAQVGSAPALSATSRDALAVRALAARAQQGVYLVEGAGGSVGAGFVAWVQAGKNRSLLITARAVIAGLLAGGEYSVYVRRGDRFWTGRVVGADRDAGLALVQVGTVLERPLWQAGADQEPLEPGAKAYLVPAGPDTPFGEGLVRTATSGRLALDTGSAALNLGAPVLGANGRLGGIVVATSPNGVNTVVPIEAACGSIRRCR